MRRSSPGKWLGLFLGFSFTALVVVIFRPYIAMLPGQGIITVALLTVIDGLAWTFIAERMVGERWFASRAPLQPGASVGYLKDQLKILDTSSIIDGRITDLCKTGFLEGVLVVPGFVIAELQKLADSADPLRRNRGRRGLELLNRIRKENLIAVKIIDKDFDELSEVDTKLLRLTREIDAKVITNDYNLNKVAELYGVRVLNINELSNAIKPVFLPGEEMAVRILRDGKELGQGVGYLEDGTMIVVEGGKSFIGYQVDITVTSVLQTAAGRMIFAKPREVVGREASSLG